jgi:hypothetical protein
MAAASVSERTNIVAKKGGDGISYSGNCAGAGLAAAIGDPRHFATAPHLWPISAWCHPNIPPVRSAALAPSPRLETFTPAPC